MCWKAETVLCQQRSLVFQVVTYGCDSWTIKEEEHWRIDAFKRWCWRRLLSVAWTARRSNQSILREINLSTCWKDWCWSWNSSILVIWCKLLTHWKVPHAGKDWGQKEKRAGVRGWSGWMASPTQWTWIWANFRRLRGTGRPGLLQSMGSQRVGHNWATEHHHHLLRG